VPSTDLRPLRRTLQEGRHRGVGIRRAEEVQREAVAPPVHALHQGISAARLLFTAPQPEGQHQCPALVHRTGSSAQVSSIFALDRTILSYFSFG